MTGLRASYISVIFSHARKLGLFAYGPAEQYPLCQQPESLELLLRCPALADNRTAARFIAIKAYLTFQ